MSGKGGGSAPAKAATAASSGKAKKSRSESSASATSDDPFEVAAPVTGKVIQLHSKPGKGRLHRIVCPMCETPGFHSKKAAGREVRCANNECLVPLFTAPPLEGDSSDEPAPVEKKGMGIVHYLVVGIVAAAALGGGAWYLMDDRPSGSGEDGEFIDPGPPTTPIVEQNGTDQTTDPNGKVDVEPAVPAGPPAAELRQQALQLMQKFSLDAESNRKPHCRRLSAEAWALQGEAGFTQVNENLAQLDVVGGESMAYQRMLPLVGIAWNSIEDGKPDVAANIVDQFPELIEKLPLQGMLALDNVTELAVLFVALDRTDEARTLLASKRNVGPLGQLMESLSRSRFTGMAYDTAVELRPVLGWLDPQTVAVTVGLTARGLGDKAAAWATDSANSSECLAAWAETAIYLAGSASPLPEIQERGQSLPPVEQVRFLSRVGLTLHAVDADAEAKTVLAAASEALKGLGTPQPVPLPNLKEQRSYTPPDKSALARNALAALELAQLELALNGQDAAWAAVQGSLTQARGMSPSLTDARQPFDEMRRIGDGGVTSQLRALHGLLTDDDAKNAFVSYQDRCRRLLRSATNRFALQERILTAAAEWGMVERVWGEMQSRASEELPSKNEPWYETQLAELIHDWFEHSKQEEKRAEVEKLAARSRPQDERKLSAPRFQTGLVSAKLLDEARIPQLAQLLTGFGRQYPDETDRRWQQETILRSASHLVQAGNVDEAISFVEALQDLQIRSEAAELIGAEMTAAGHREKALKHSRFGRMNPADKVALLRGFLERLPDDPPAPTPTEETDGNPET